MGFSDEGEIDFNPFSGEGEIGFNPFSGEGEIGFNPFSGEGEIGISRFRQQLLQAHGILMLVAWPVLAFTAIFFAAWMKQALPNGEWFQVGGFPGDVMMM